MAGISEGEVAVYDRQLRLWGVQAQQRLLKAKVLIWGLEGCNVEVCKNLVLAGVSLVIRDHRKVEPADVAFNYFLREEDLGKNRAECAAKRVQEMNPLCAVSCSTQACDASGAAALKEELQGCDVVCLALGVLGFDAAKASEIDAACREVNSCFILNFSAGELAFFFSNLNSHTVQEKSSAQGPGPAPEDTKPPELETVQFASFQEWLACSPADLQKQKADASFMFVALFLAFARSSKQATPEAASKFDDYCRTVAKCTPSVDGFADLKQAYACVFVEPLMHVASVVAGLLAQEVIKAITKRDTPLANSVCFNAHTSTALVERIPALAKAPVKRKIEEVADLLD